VLSEDILPVTTDSQLCTVRILKYIASNEFMLSTLLTAPFALFTAGPINLWLARNMLPTEAFEMRAVILTLSAAKNETKPEAVLKNYELFICGGIHDVTSLFCQKLLKLATT